ncbi:MAG TPA: PEGA domain-containing protein [Usitatibacter sp.]|jgi:hypothetical protein|nr:PEGA domain-containing protein [Usitatibacter sp.]
MQDSASPTSAHVAFLRIPGFDGRSVAEQASLKDRLEGRVRAAIGPIAATDRLVLDADDGVALVLFGDAPRALRIAQSLRGEEAFLQVGLNHGPVARNPAAGTVFGDGLAAAAAAARFATPERILVTQEFRRKLEETAPELAQDLVSAGEFTDSRLRQHLLFTPDPLRGATRRRRYLVRLGGGVAAILLLGVVAHEARVGFFAPKPAVIMFAVKPRGDVYVDGVAKGRTPPLDRIELNAGRHNVTIRNPGFPPLQLTLNLEAGQQTTITHTFAARRPPENRESPGFWRDLKRRFGGS